MNILILTTGIALSVFFLYMFIISLVEKEYRAAKISFVFSILILIPFLLIYFIDFSFKDIISYTIIGLILGLLLVLFLPIRPGIKDSFQIPIKKHDERDIMFSRNELIPETEKFENYYQQNLEKRELDDKFRTKPGLLSRKSSLFHPFTFASAEANLQIIEVLKPLVNADLADIKEKTDPQKITSYIKNWTKQLGAHSVGITLLKDYHLYSYKGRGKLYGHEINNKHTFAIALTVEMNHQMMQTAPQGPVVMESTQQYLNSGTIALQIAHFIRNLGYSAKAHIDGNYELICPLVARDAGLGEIGRMGLLMTPKLGPRVRIAVVTTELPLIMDNQKDNSHIIDFCEICKKCADICPSASIPDGTRENIDGALRWKINHEKCFTYWCTVGTDCGKCMTVCPFSHPDNFLHNVIRWGIYNSYIFRRFALFMDDLFYGRKPKTKPISSWMQ